jgi:hypothetical protein
MVKYQVRIGSEIGPYWGEFTVKSTQVLKERVAENIEALHPLNSSDEGAELYRQRFRGKPIYIKKPEDKDYQLLN